jgi:acyl-CoA dehydrogenase
MCRRASDRVAFGRTVAEQGVHARAIAEARIMIDALRFMVLNAAWKMDTVGNKIAQEGDRDDQGDARRTSPAR